MGVRVFALASFLFLSCHPPAEPVLSLPAALEPQRSALDADVHAGQQRLLAFASRWGWLEHTREPFTRRYEVYDDKRAYDARLIALTGAPPGTAIPATFTAALESGIFIAVSPALYRAAYPDGDEPGAFSKLVTHELAHRLHVRLVDGREDEMGPTWFFEGFAIVAAEQFAADTREPSHDEMLAILHASERGSYRSYAGLMRTLLKRIALPELVAHARRQDFASWIERQIP